MGTNFAFRKSSGQMNKRVKEKENNGKIKFRRGEESQNRGPASGGEGGQVSGERVTGCREDHR